MINIKKNLHLFLNLKPIVFHCFTSKCDIELFLPDFLKGFSAFGYNVIEDTFWAKKQCKSGPIYININIFNLGFCDSNVQIKTLYGNQKDVEVEVKKIYDKIKEYSAILHEIGI
jgi:hypothetical protein